MKPNLFDINLRDILHLQEKSHVSIYNVLNFGDGVRLTKPLLSELISHNESNYFKDTNHDLFLPCLIQHLILIEQNTIERTLDHYWQIAKKENKTRNFIEYFNDKLDVTFRYFEHSIPNLHIKRILIKEWLQSIKQGNINGGVEEGELGLFKLTYEEVIWLVNGLKNQGALLDEQTENAKNFFIDKRVQEVKFESRALCLIDLFYRVITKYNQKFYRKSVAATLSEIAYYRNFKTKEYKLLDYRHTRQKLSEVKSYSPSRGRLALDIFPDTED